MANTSKLHDLVRTLNLVPYLRKHPGATPFEIARDLNMQPKEVMEDLQRLHLSGVGTGPGEMFDLVADWTSVTLLDDQGVNKALRLTPTEAGALLLTLESLETMPGLVDQQAVTSAANKLRAVIDSHGVYDTVAAADASRASVISQALAEQVQLELTYFSASSNSTTTRTVSPQRLFHRDGQTYLHAYDGESSKTFRFDRITEVTLLDEPSTAPNTPFDREDPFGLRDMQVSELLVAPEATWLSQYWELELIEETPSGWWKAEMPYGSVEWIVRFCLSQADRLRPVSPQVVVGEVARRAESGLAGYDSSNDRV